MFVSALLQFAGSGTAGSTRTSTSSRQNANSQKAIVNKNTNAQFPIITQLNYGRQKSPICQHTQLTISTGSKHKLIL